MPLGLLCSMASRPPSRSRRCRLQLKVSKKEYLVCQPTSHQHGLVEVTSPLRFPSAYEARRCRCAEVFFQPMLHLVPALRKVFCIQRYTWCEDTRSCDSPRRLFRISRISYVKMYSGRLSWTLFSLVASRAVTDRLLFRLRSTCLNCRCALLRSLRLECKCRVRQFCHLRRLFGCISYFST